MNKKHVDSRPKKVVAVNTDPKKFGLQSGALPRFANSEASEVNCAPGNKPYAPLKK